MKTLAGLVGVCLVLYSTAQSAPGDPYGVPFRNPIHLEQAASFGQPAQALGSQLPSPVAQQSSNAVYRQPFLNRNGVISRNPDAIWNDPVEYEPAYRTPVPGAQFLVYGDPKYGGYRGTFGGQGQASTGGYLGYKAKRASSKKKA